MTEAMKFKVFESHAWTDLGPIQAPKYDLQNEFF